MKLDEKVYANFICKLNEKMYEFRKMNFSNLVFLCIGSDRITGDCFGPLVGHTLKNKIKKLNECNNIFIIGTLEEPLCATNIKEKLEYIKNKYEKPYIVAVDAAFSKKEDIGKVIVSDKSMRIGKGIDKNLEPIGNVSIKGIVAKDYKIPKINFTILQNTSLNLVMNLAEDTARGIYEVIKYN